MDSIVTFPTLYIYFNACNAQSWEMVIFLGTNSLIRLRTRNIKSAMSYSQIKAGLAALRITGSQSKQSSYMNTETGEPSLSEHLNQQEFVYIQDFFFNRFTQDKT